MPSRKMMCSTIIFRTHSITSIDGIGLLRAINRAVGTKYGTENRFPGTDFFSYLPPGRTVRVYLYGSRIEHLEAAKEEIERQFPGVQIVEWTFLL
ncbi:MAG: WecB/TagA/CpsF family glycosyltransferase [Lachnospiraceae bacterium]|nr:WecB/TagA/CpsF family glycosyltransferase [Lachnospiraceae bacterium]